MQALGKQINLPVYDEGTTESPLKIVEHGVRVARDKGNATVIIDTAGRLQINEQLMQELVDIKKLVKPHEILLVADAMTGQEAVNVAREFNEQGRPHRRDHDEDGRRRSRWRGPLDPPRHRRADQVPRHRREDRRAGSRITPIASPRESSAWAMC